MNQDSQDPGTHSGVSYEDRLPVDWEVLAQPLTDGEILQLNTRNEELLSILLTLDEAHTEAEERDEKGESAGLLRLEGKLDLLLGMLGELLLSNTTLPPIHAVSLTSTQLQVQIEPKKKVKQPREGSNVKIHLFISPRLPRPIELLGSVVSREEATILFSLVSMEERFRDLLAKFIFRQHRRNIALARSKDNQ
jgi:hypothetical protein